VRTKIVAGLVCLVVSACTAGGAEQGNVSTPASPSDPNGCPVTVPAQPGFVPPAPYPPEPPFGQVWYGTAELWTHLDPNGDVWRDLPVEKDGSIFNKTLWFSERFPRAAEGDFTGRDHVTLTAVRLDRSAPTVVEHSQGMPGFRRDIKNFKLVGLVLPKPGCWEVTAGYRGAELAYVLQVVG
jgi:hypothetical protein